jgi:hypothetical protein
MSTHGEQHVAKIELKRETTAQFVQLPRGAHVPEIQSKRGSCFKLLYSMYTVATWCA